MAKVTPWGSDAGAPAKKYKEPTSEKTSPEGKVSSGRPSTPMKEIKGKKPTPYGC